MHSPSTDFRNAARRPSTTPRAIQERLGATFARATRRISDALSRQAFNRRVLYLTSVMNDAELAAVGLTRADVARAAGLREGDPTHYLLDRRDARRVRFAGPCASAR